MFVDQSSSTNHTLVGFTEPQCCGMFGHIVNVEPGLFVSQLISVKCESTCPLCIYMFSERAYWSAAASVSVLFDSPDLNQFHWRVLIQSLGGLVLQLSSCGSYTCLYIHLNLFYMCKAITIWCVKKLKVEIKNKSSLFFCLHSKLMETTWNSSETITELVSSWNSTNLRVHVQGVCVSPRWTEGLLCFRATPRPCMLQGDHHCPCWTAPRPPPWLYSALHQDGAAVHGGPLHPAV